MLSSYKIQTFRPQAIGRTYEPHPADALTSVSLPLPRGEGNGRAALLRWGSAYGLGRIAMRPYRYWIAGTWCGRKEERRSTLAKRRSDRSTINHNGP